jgi:hypothetical protein
MEVLKLREWEVVSVLFPCGQGAKIDLRALKDALRYGSWVPLCILKCPNAYGRDAIFKCEILRGALPLKGIETAISWTAT